MRHYFWKLFLILRSLLLAGPAPLAKLLQMRFLSES
ncbi:hypothetical protein MCETALH18_01556 [Methylophilaceae bacterium]